MATINFLFRSKKARAPLTIRLLFRNKDNDITLGAKTRCLVSNVYWNKYHTAKSIKNAEMKTLSRRVSIELTEIEGYILDWFYKTSADEIDKKWLVNRLAEYYEPTLAENNPGGSLIEFFEEYIEFKGGNLKKPTIKKYRQIKNRLSVYEDDQSITLRVNKIDSLFKQDYEEYCNALGYSTNTIAKDFKTIRTICRFAGRRGQNISRELSEVKLKNEDSDFTYLTPKDLEKIAALDNIPEYLDNAKDWLLISCYTGQRVSDFMRFSKKMIRDTTNKDGESVKLIEFKQQKTNSIISLPLDSTVIHILEKRNGDFPRKISDQPYNRFIKEVCKKAGLTNLIRGSKKELIKLSGSEEVWRKQTGRYKKWELVTSHIGRRSFATNHYGSIPTVYLKYATGHKTEEMFLNYIGKNSQDLALGLAEYF